MFTMNVKENKIKLISIDKNETNSEKYRKIWYGKYKVKIAKNEETSYDKIMSYLNDDNYKREKNL
jgi:hypothetical protein